MSNEAPTFFNTLAWAAMGRWLRQLIGLAAYVLLARWLGPEAYGILGMTAAVTTLAQLLIVDGAPIFIIRAKEVDAGHLNAIFWLGVVIAGAFTLAMITGGGVLARFYGEPIIAPILAVQSVMPTLYALVGVPNALLQRRLQYRALAVRLLLSGCVGAGVGLAMGFAGWGIWSLVAMAPAQWAAQAIVLWMACGWRPGKSMRYTHVRSVILFARDALATQLLHFLDLQAPIVVIGAALGAHALGLFAMAWRIVEVLSMLTTMSISEISVPFLARLQAQRGDIGKGVDAAFQLSASIALPCFLGIIAIAEPMVQAIFGAAWADAIPVVRLAAALGLAWATLSCFDAAMLAQGEMRARTWMSFIGLAALCVGLKVTAHLGLEAVIATLVVRDLVFCALYGVVLRRVVGGLSRAALTVIASLAVAAAVMAAAVFVWCHSADTHGIAGLWRLSVAVVIGIVVYGSAVMLLARRFVDSFLRPSGPWRGALFGNAATPDVH